MKEYAETFYKSAVWKKTSKEYIRSVGGLCERCEAPAKIAHHKIYLTPENINDPNMTLSWDNLEALCQDCHNKEHHTTKREKRYIYDEYGNILPPL